MRGAVTQNLLEGGGKNLTHHQCMPRPCPHPGPHTLNPDSVGETSTTCGSKMAGSRCEPGNAHDRGLGQGCVSTPVQAPVPSLAQQADDSEGGNHSGQHFTGEHLLRFPRFQYRTDWSAEPEERGATYERSHVMRGQVTTLELGSESGSPEGAENGDCNQESRVREAITRAGVCLLGGDYRGCLLVLEAAQQLSSSSEADVERLTLICRMHINGEAHAWRQVVGVPEGGPPQAEHVRRAFRRLAGLVHPDKCKLPGAEAAFKLLGAAVTHLLGEAGHITAGGEVVSPGGGVWWDAWQADSAEGRKRKRAADTLDEAAAAADLESLRGLPIEALKAEVRRRQHVVLTPVKGSVEGALSRQARQLRLRVSRTMLNNRVAEAIAQLNPIIDGGFL